MKRAILVVSLLLVSGCSNLPTSPGASGSTPDAATRALTAANGIQSEGSSTGVVRINADGDIKNGPLEILRVRIRQAGNGFYALPSGNYQILTGTPVEAWVEWASDRALADPPRLIIDWTASDRDNIHCGPCLLSRTYRDPGRYTVTVTLDDRAGGVTRRTFTFDARSELVPRSQVVSEVLSPWSITLLFTNPTNSGLKVSLRSITWHRGDTGAQVGSQPDLVNFFVFSAGQLPATGTIPGGLTCGQTGGAPGFFRWITDVEAGDGSRSQTPFQSSTFPCS
ncbi:MAG: hypothetical protein K1Y01_06550 [Vicinamibacteria bacterium]|nr:hypothetical protein [Vicinamibacteria bacterium]